MADQEFIAELLAMVDCTHAEERQKLLDLLKQLTAVVQQQRTDIQDLKNFRAEAVRGRAIIAQLQQENADLRNVHGSQRSRFFPRPTYADLVQLHPPVSRASTSASPTVQRYRTFAVASTGHVRPKPAARLRASGTVTSASATVTSGEYHLQQQQHAPVRRFAAKSTSGRSNATKDEPDQA